MILNDKQVTTRIIAPEFLLAAYRQGLFPMAVEPGRIEWFSPTQRGILPLDAFHIPHGLRRSLKTSHWNATIDMAFSDVISACARRAETWIDEMISASYRHLHDLGYAHSLEIWLDNKLAGGLYGVVIGGAFFGESMFHQQRDGSKVALKVLVDILIHSGFCLLDTQWVTPHLEQFGVRAVPHTTYLALLESALRVPAQFPAKGEFPIYSRARIKSVQIL